MPRNFNPAKLCEMKEVESSQLSKVGFVEVKSAGDPTGILFIDFSKTPDTKFLYLYFPVLKKSYDDLLESESKGSYFIRNIKNNENITCIKVPN